jgi:bifunctional ADP-heptose synthase (sugar kinase/adenylyltransferase)
VRDDEGLHEIPGIGVSGDLDTTGAGDAVLAGIAACLASGQDPVTAAVVGNLAASVTVRKRCQTGTVTAAELIEAARADQDSH